MTTTAWVLVGLAAWVVVAVLVALVVGRVVRMRDRQVSEPLEQPDLPRSSSGPPEQRGRTEPPGPQRRRS